MVLSSSLFAVIIFPCLNFCDEQGKIKGKVYEKSEEFVMENGLTHFDSQGNAVMVDVSEKNITHRVAIASGKIYVNDAVYEAIVQGNVKKGDVLGVARVAGIMAAKKTHELIPMCHPLLLTKCTVDFEMLPEEKAVKAIATVKVNGQTGVEMEALTAVNVTLLTIYDMCKAIDKTMELDEIHLEEKSGGKSGTFINPNCRKQG